MRIKWMALLLAAVMVIGSGGCAQLRDKFIRKKKEEPGMKRYTVVKPYDVRPSLDLYTKRYVYWKNWHRELLDVIDHSNHKKTVVAVEQELSNLVDMQNMLVDEKAQELQEYIDELTEIELTIKKERVTLGNKTRLVRKLEALGRGVKRDFSYNKMRRYIADDFRQDRSYTGEYTA
ncbi:MAG: hypothetical protein GF408_08305 [Candidatus Omnitrophica bacterium]|nr:hypothetical protein [Candidatus Omnitrophota bacterium]